VLANQDGVSVVVPVTDRGEAVGVLEMVLGRPPDEATLAQLVSAAHALALVVIANAGTLMRQVRCFRKLKSS